MQFYRRGHYWIGLIYLYVNLIQIFNVSNTERLLEASRPGLFFPVLRVCLRKIAKVFLKVYSRAIAWASLLRPWEKGFIHFHFFVLLSFSNLMATIFKDLNTVPLFSSFEYLKPIKNAYEANCFDPFAYCNFGVCSG